MRELKPCLLRREDGPLYRQLLDRMRAPIDSGALGVGSALPREAVLAERFGVSLITVRQALRELEIEGLIKKQTAKPAVVAAPGQVAQQPGAPVRAERGARGRAPKDDDESDDRKPRGQERRRDQRQQQNQ